MRDLFAGIVAVVLLLVAASLATTLTLYRRRRQKARDSESALGRRIVAELPMSEDLVLFSEDRVRFHYGDRSIDKDLIEAAVLLINGVPIAKAVFHRPMRKPPDSAGAQADGTPTQEPSTLIEDRPEGIIRDRWDVAIETVTGVIVVECGAIRERVSQELARAVFDSVKLDIERRNEKDRRPSDAERAS